MTSPALLSALAEETAALARPVERISAVLGELIGKLPAETRGSAVVEAQALDVVVQRLEAIAQALSGLALGASDAEILADLKLSDLVARLKGSARDHTAVEAGDCELFD